jgi:xylulokinase
MSRTYLIGVDLGTSVVKATLFDLDGNAVAHATRATTLHQPQPGIAEQAPDEFVAKTLDLIAEVVEKSAIEPTDVAAIGFDGQMGGLMGIDSQWNPVTPWYPSTLDSRYQPYLEEAERRYGNRVFELAGAAVLGAPRMAWWKDQHPDIYRKIDKVLILANYVAGRLAGLSAEDAFIDPSSLTWIGTAETRERAWSDELLDIWELTGERLPRIVPSATVIGHLSETSAPRCGLAAGVPLVAGAGDQVAGFVGAGVVDAGECIDVAGTFPVFATCADQFLVDTENGMFQSLAGPLGDDNWYWMMYIGGGGLTHRWFVEQFSTGMLDTGLLDTDLLNTGHADSAKSLYALLDEQARAVPAGANGLLFLPHLGGRICPVDADSRGAWIGFDWTHTRAHFYRALLESVGYDFAQALRVLRTYSPELDLSGVRVIGGGASSELWNQIKADVLGLPYFTLQHADCAILGSALIAGHAVGIYHDLADAARSCARITSNTMPQPDIHQVYEPYVDAYIEAFDQLRPTFDTLAALRRD